MPVSSAANIICIDKPTSLELARSYHEVCQLRVRCERLLADAAPDAEEMSVCTPAPTCARAL
jgi:hypothetical protein